MAIPDIFRAFANLLRSATPGFLMGRDPYRSRDVQLVMSTYGVGSSDPERMAPDEIWKTQPHLRTVVTFIAENVAQLGMHAFRLDGEERARVRDGLVADWLRRPNSEQTFTEFIEQLVGELSLYDSAWVWVAQPTNREAKETRVIPTKWVTTRENAFGMIESVSFQDPLNDGHRVEVDPSEMCRFTSWAPGAASGGVSKVETLRLILSEQHAAWMERNQVARRKGRMAGFFRRPKDAADWDDAARQRFMRMARDYMGNDGARAGEDMLLEDGMSYERATRTAAESQWAESVKLSLETCAQVFHINPTMVGVLDNANYSNVKEFRQSLYTDTLGPIIRKIEDRFNSFLLPALGIEPDVFVEFNVEAKLRGSFEERTAIMSKATGGPWMTRNETRKLSNLPPIEGGDELIVPANVLVGGLASPLDGGEGRPAEPKAQAAVVAASWFERMKRSVEPRKASGVPWWDPGRWKRELETDLVKAGIDAMLAASWSAEATFEAEEFFQGGPAPKITEGTL